jgi:hypothetical protein
MLPIYDVAATANNNFLEMFECLIMRNARAIGKKMK